MKKASLFYILLFLFVFFVVPTKASHCPSTDYDCQLLEIQSEIDSLSPAHENNKKNLSDLKSQISGISVKIENLSKELDTLAVDIITREEDLAFAKEVFDQKTESHYRFIRFYDPLFPFFSSTDASDAIRKITFRQKAIDEDRLAMEELAGELSQLREDKELLEKSKVSLAAAKGSLDEQATFLGTEVEKVAGYLSELSSRQLSLLAEKAGSFSVSIGDAALADDYDASLAGWQAKAPSDSVTIFSFGAYAGNGSNYRRNGMSQYGALGRVNENPGISYEQILQAYYPGSQLVDYSVMGSISVDGHGTIPFEDNYLLGIHEVPESWPMAVLKAQVVAARTYAVRVTNNGQSSICSTDRCQVYESNLKTGDWAGAVTGTKGKILVDSGGNPVSTQYVSTPGGYLDTKGWDTNCGSEGCLAGGAYDRNSPWFYKAWYTHYRYGQGFSSCKRDNPWLSQSDISDILNAWSVYTNGNDEDRIRILPPNGCGGGDPYSLDEMKNRADSLGGSYTSVGSVNIQQSSQGHTSKVIFNTNKGSVDITGFDTGCAHAQGGCQDFWTIFNLRAPGNISIKNRMFDLRVK